MPHRIILDTDPGVDDALAILFAVKSTEFQVDAITTISGNVNVEKTTSNALKILQALDRPDIPVARGEEKPLVRPHINAEWIHGRDGLGDSALPPSLLQPVPEHAVDLLIRMISESMEGTLTLVATGPLTNVAQVFIRKPHLAERLDHLVLMGGAYGLTEYGIGNVTREAEYNIYEDPEAAQAIFHSGARITAVGLDVTANPAAALTAEHINDIVSGGSPLAGLVQKITKKMMSRWRRIYLHDPVAVAVALDKTLVRTESYSVNVDLSQGTTRGKTMVRSNSTYHSIDIAISLDASRFLHYFLKRLGSD